MNFTLRAATLSDQSRIRSLIRSVRINPMGLDWRNFYIIVTPANEMIGCGQVKMHADGSRELASIAVLPEYRNLGVASTIVDHLLNIHPKPLYLTCRSGLEPFYQRFGFKTIQTSQMPRYFKRISRLANFILRLTRSGEKLLVMQYSP